MYWHDSSSSIEGQSVKIVAIVPSTNRGIFNVFVWNPSGLWGSVGSSQSEMPQERHWLGLISDLSIMSPNKSPCPNTNMYIWLVWLVHAVAAVHISMLSVVVYSERKGETEHIKSDQLSGLRFFPKQCVSAWLSISVLSASLKILLLSSHFWRVLVIWDEATPTRGSVEVRGVGVRVQTRTDNIIQ